MDALINQFSSLSPRPNAKKLEAEILLYLMSNPYRTRISDSRAFLKRPLTQPEKTLLSDLVHATTDAVGYKESIEVIDLIKAGILARNHKGDVIFTAPVVRAAFIWKLYGESAPRSFTVASLEEFIVECVTRMNPDILKRSKSIGADKRLLERQWQMEFYRCAVQIVSHQHSISPDVGQIFNSEGFLDFYVDDTWKWGIELLREGDEMKSHSERFAPGGIYEAIAPEMAAWVILDFRTEEKAIRKQRKKFWHILYNDDYSAVTIINKKLKAPIQRKLLGNQL